MANPIAGLFRWQETPVGKVIAESKRTIWFTFWLTFLAELLSLAPIIYMINLFQRVVPSQSMPTLISLTLLVIAVFIFWSAIEWVRSRMLVRLSLRLDWDLAPEVFDATFRAHLGKKNVNVQQLLTDLLEFRQFITGAPMLAIMALPFGFIFIIVGAMIHPYLAIFIAVALIALLIAAYITQKITTPILKEANDNFTEANRKANIFIRNAETTFSLGMLPAARKHWYDAHRAYLGMQVNASEATGLTGGFSGFLNKSFPSLAKALIAFLVLQNVVSASFIFVGALLIMRAMQPLQNLLNGWGSMVKARQAYDRLNVLLADHRTLQAAMALPPPTGKLEVTDLVGIPPQAQKRVVDSVSFSLNPGQAVAIVGTSASGKSSLAKLLIGVWKPAAGHVRLDGVEISDWNHDEVGPLIGYVPQEIAFFEGTIAENIARLGEVDSEKVVEAATLVNMHEAILAFPKGYDTPIGDVAAFGLSGGQRQRLAIARALYGNPKFVVMDEPNANLDDQGEQALVTAIAHLKKLGSTVVVTTHRPRLIGSVEFLLVLKDGKQVAFGPAQKVIEQIRNVQTATRKPPDAAKVEDSPKPVEAPSKLES
jgi:ATP-binding cassette, subfamily C, bacterial exporter for protease/lipase